MDRHLLVTVSEQKSALYGVKFVGNFFSDKKGLKITLYYTCPRAAAWDDDIHKGNQARQEKQYEARGRRALEDAKQTCCRLGFEADQIAFKLESRKTSKVMDILYEGAKRRYDAVVLGRRGVSWLEEAFDESVTKGLLKETFHFPVWLCNKPEPHGKNVLVCVDGSEAAYRMTDHVGFMLEKESRQAVTLFVAGEDLKASEKIIAEALVQLAKNGFPEQRIKTLIIPEKNAAAAILLEVKGKQYAAVAVGRRSSAQKTLKGLFFGSVSTRLFNEMEGAGLWICY